MYVNNTQQNCQGHQKETAKKTQEDMITKWNVVS
jgi:hypothetical protein